MATIRKDKSVRKTKEQHEMTPEERMESDLTDMRCLWLCIAVLERVDGVNLISSSNAFHPSFTDNKRFDSLLKTIRLWKEYWVISLFRLSNARNSQCEKKLWLVWVYVVSSQR